MTQTEIQQIYEYLKEVKDALYDPDIGPVSKQAELAKLEETITQLMVTAAETKDGVERVKLGYLETKARHCREIILIRMGKQN